MPKAVCLIVNPSAGGGKARRAAPAAEQALRGHGLTVRVAHTRDLAHARELGLEAARAGETVVALSGDGMLGALADALRETPGAVLGVLPGGRGNDLAHVLGISDDIATACATIAHGATRAIDLGAVADPAAGASASAFVGIASAGFDSDANRIANEAPSWLGALVYVYGALRALAAWKPARFEIELDPPGERRAFSGFSVGAANSKTYGGGMRAAPDALLDDGLLEILILEDVGKVKFLTKILLKVFKGTHVDEPGVHVLRAREVVLSADRPFTIYADGDPIGELPVRVSALRAAVTMIVPAPDPPDSAFASPSPTSAAASAQNTPGTAAAPPTTRT